MISFEGIRNRYAKLYFVVGKAGFGTPRIVLTALEWTPSPAIIRSPVATVPSARVIEPASAS